MSLRPDGTYHCDRCGNDVVNGGPVYSAAISGFDRDNPQVPWLLHLCLHCRDEVLTENVLADYYENRNPSGGPG